MHCARFCVCFCSNCVDVDNADLGFHRRNFGCRRMLYFTTSYDQKYTCSLSSVSILFWNKLSKKKCLRWWKERRFFRRKIHRRRIQRRVAGWRKQNLSILLLMFVRDCSQQRLEPMFKSNFFGDKLWQTSNRRIDSDAGASLAERSRREEYLSGVQQRRPWRGHAEDEPS